MTSVTVNAVLGFIMLVTLCFTLGDVNDILSSATGYPFIQIFYNTTGSYAATNALTAILVLTLTASTITEVATASRQLWSFARDKGVPFSDFFSYVRILPDPWQKYARLVNHDFTGHARMEYPTQRGHGLACCDCSSFSN
jgi:amino acid transporter